MDQSMFLKYEFRTVLFISSNYKSSFCIYKQTTAHGGGIYPAVFPEPVPNVVALAPFNLGDSSRMRQIKLHSDISKFLVPLTHKS